MFMYLYMYVGSHTTTITLKGLHRRLSTLVRDWDVHICAHPLLNIENSAHQAIVVQRRDSCRRKTLTNSLRPYVGMPLPPLSYIECVTHKDAIFENSFEYIRHSGCPACFSNRV